MPKTKITATVSGSAVSVTVEGTDAMRAQLRNAVVSVLSNYMGELATFEVKEIA